MTAEAKEAEQKKMVCTPTQDKCNMTQYSNSSEKLRNQFFMNQLSGNTLNSSRLNQGHGVPHDKVESLQESIMAMKHVKGHNSFATPEKSYDDMDCVKIEVAVDQVSIEKPAGMLERVR